MEEISVDPQDKPNPSSQIHRDDAIAVESGDPSLMSEAGSAKDLEANMKVEESQKGVADASAEIEEEHVVEARFVVGPFNLISSEIFAMVCELETQSHGSSRVLLNVRLKASDAEREQDLSTSLALQEPQPEVQQGVPAAGTQSLAMPTSTQVSDGEVLGPVIASNGDLDASPKPGNLASSNVAHIEEIEGSEPGGAKDSGLTTEATLGETNGSGDGTKTAPIATLDPVRSTEPQPAGTGASTSAGKKVSKVRTFVGGFRPKGRTNPMTSGPSQGKGGKGSSCIIF